MSPKFQSAFSLVELMVVMVIFGFTFAGAIQYFGQQSRKSIEIQRRVARENQLNQVLQIIEKDIKFSGSNPKFAGGNAKSDDTTFQSIGGDNYPFGVNLDLSGSHDIAAFYRYNNPDLSKDWGFYFEEETIYELTDADSEGIKDDLVRHNIFSNGSDDYDFVTLMLKDVASVEVLAYQDLDHSSPGISISVTDSGRVLNYGIIDAASAARISRVELNIELSSQSTSIVKTVGASKVIRESY